MNLQQKLDAFKSNFETRVAPPEVVDVFHRTTAELIATGQAERSLKVGDLAPTFTLANAEGEVVSSTEMLKQGPLVVTFYRGVWCPYCNIDLQAIEEVADEIRTLGASLVSISMQTATSSLKSQRQNKLSYPILVDEGGKTADGFGIRFRLQDELIDAYKGFDIDLPVINGEPSWTLPMPARYVIAQDGTIAYAEVSPDYTKRPDPGELVAALKKLKTVA
ncbi:MULTISPECIES: peroxiredoxin-like family protein [Paraburkholderia]|jgi:peroxiredoxin|uniref:thioredoxin-dependent peroxiredoxin n=1 Tax=Paraburkholderia largidicola TaxID=3014751 RepID=A0A7I8BXQ6_9BURK|nr:MULTISPECIES: peroxiredoxin-like family protein [Paraburkholderia]BCF93205.1 peroxiredoxin [Paraburkholderia sp. PGU16]BEU26381.1 peroxiredoxin-like family protein [Paraburkholderia sp. 22B1P]GJH32534.1 redoxin domain-containing protein [Paraburkholderia hospita]CAG9240965.1 Peroxiredoxin [Paraburkholderia caribensis]